MTARETRRADELTDGTLVVEGSGYRLYARTFTTAGHTTLVDAAGNPSKVKSDKTFYLATADEYAEYTRDRDRHAVADALTRVGNQIVRHNLPVPPGGKGVVLSFDLADDADLGPWAEYLSKHPQRGTSRPLIQAEAEGVEVYVYGPGNSGEFGPDLVEDLADVAHAEKPCARCGTAAVLNSVELCTRCALDVHVLGDDTERRDAVGAFPVVAEPGVWVPCTNCRVIQVVSPVELCSDCLADERAKTANDELRAELSERDGWAPPGGHKTAATEDAYRADRYSGEG